MIISALLGFHPLYLFTDFLQSHMFQDKNPTFYAVKFFVSGVFNTKTTAVQRWLEPCSVLMGRGEQWSGQSNTLTAAERCSAPQTLVLQRARGTCDALQTSSTLIMSKLVLTDTK